MGKFRGTVAVASLILCVAGCTKHTTGNVSEILTKPEQKVYTMQIAHAQPTNNPRHISLEVFKKLVEEKTAGGIKVEIYPAGQLGTEKEMLDQTCSGIIQGFRGGQFEFLPKLLIFSLPFLCETPEEITRLMSSDFAKKVCEDAKESGAIILGLGDAGGFRQFSNSRHPITKVSDFADLKMRTNGMDTVDKTLKAFGAQTVSIPYNDLYKALKTGIADGQENPWINVEGMRFYEVQKFFTEINYQFHPDPFYVNLDWYTALPEQYKRILQECTGEMMRTNNSVIAANQQAALNAVKANAQVYTLSAKEREEFKKAAESVYDQYIAEGRLTREELEQMRRIVAGEDRPASE